MWFWPTCARKTPTLRPRFCATPGSRSARPPSMCHRGLRPGARRAAAGLGEVTGVIHAAGVSPSQASPATILAVDLYGTAVVLEEFGNVIASGGSGVVIASQSGHRLRRTDGRAEHGARDDARRRFALACRCCSRIRSRTRSTPTSSPSAATRCASCTRPSAGGSVARGSTRSAPASSSRRLRGTSSPARAAKATGG